ncbi:hypothetical protein HNP99_000219 [Flavobacterium sp. 28A]|uniref:hypothetical protein n=1 Tax=Flavobacterium sp. 28A TaxID=2735895 RepID=UPI00156E48C0|nr:hypothetical protein [Flavobacterium sp. 28A]NRT13894.1 hypothetical protein [Flavobacterium sp. 28A]
MKKIVALLIMLSTSLAYSQIIIRFGLGEQDGNGIIFKKNKEQIEGEVHFPKLSDNKVKIKVGNQNEKIMSADIDSIQILDAKKKLAYTFVWVKTKEFKSKGTDFKIKEEGWILLMKKGKLSLYIGGDEYGVKKDSMRVFSAIKIYLKKKEEDYPIWVSMAIPDYSSYGGVNSIFKMYGPYYFKDNPEIVKKIKNKEYKSKDIEEVVDYYNLKVK